MLDEHYALYTSDCTQISSTEKQSARFKFQISNGEHDLEKPSDNNKSENNNIKSENN